jgi:hypothetical protein
MALTKATYSMIEGASVNVLDHGADPTGVSDSTSSIQAAVNAAPFGGDVYFPNGTYKITATINVQKTLRFYGTTSNGSVIDNTTNDVSAFVIVEDSADSRTADRCSMENLRINHQAATKYAVVWNAPFGFASNLRIECAQIGFGCLLLGSEAASPADNDLAYLFTGQHCRFWSYTDYGVRVNSRGTLWQFLNCHVASVVDGSTAGYFNKEAVSIIGGQWGGSGATSIPIMDYNTEAGDREGNTFENMVFENVSNYAISFDGATNAVAGGQAKGIYANLSSNTGTIINFGRAKQCVAELPRIKNPTSGGTLCRWGSSSVECTLICDYEAAQAPVIVGAGATKAVKIVRGRLSRTQIPNITTNAELTVILPDGSSDLPPGFIPVHNGTAWNFQLLALGDDTATSFVPPTIKGTVRVYAQDAATTTGSAAYECSAVPECISLTAGGDFNVTTGPLTGTTGTNNKVTISTATDGKIYVENRFTAANNNITVLIESEVYGL